MSERMTAPDPTVVAGNVYKLVLDNDRVRVFDVVFKPGEVAVMHSHPDHVVYVLKDATLRLAFPNGTSQDVGVTAGQALFLGAQAHETTNIGATEAHNIVIELKG